MAGITITSRSLWLAAICMFVLIPFIANAQDAETGSLKGNLYKKDKKTALKNYRIVLSDISGDEEDNREYRSEPTDEDGLFLIENILPGVYKVGLITNKGKKPSKTLTVVNVRAGETHERSFYYKPRKPLLGFWNCALAVIFAGLIIVL